MLPIVHQVNGEENEDCIFKMKAKLYRFKDGEWKERGLGFLKLLRHKQTHKIRFQLRQDKTWFIRANFLGKDFRLLLT